jgi:hypothetical protein
VRWTYLRKRKEKGMRYSPLVQAGMKGYVWSLFTALHREFPRGHKERTNTHASGYKNMIFRTHFFSNRQAQNTKKEVELNTFSSKMS